MELGCYLGRWIIWGKVTELAFVKQLIADPFNPSMKRPSAVLTCGVIRKTVKSCPEFGESTPPCPENCDWEFRRGGIKIGVQCICGGQYQRSGMRKGFEAIEWLKDMT
jgi:hypothetical protein